MFNITFLDAPERWQFFFQDPATPIMEGIIDFHHDVFFFLIIILSIVTWILGRTIWQFSEYKNNNPIIFTHGTTIEIIWTIIPSLILICIALPSFSLLYAMDEVVPANLTVKVIGHQWYWSYEYSDYAQTDETTLMYDSYMIPEEDLELGDPRLLEVDNRLVLPINTHIRLLVSSADVLHSFAVPSLGVKCDAIPGRLNQISLFILREGVFFGQCSELCGVNHGFMPIVIEAVSPDLYIEWITNQIEEQIEEI